MDSNDEDDPNGTPPRASNLTSRKNTKKRSYKSSFNSWWIKDPAYARFLAESQKGKHYARCTLCNIDFSVAASGLGSVKKHISSETHAKNVRVQSIVVPITEMPQVRETHLLNKRVKIAETKITSFLAENNLSLNMADKIVHLIQHVGKDSDVIPKLQLGRTKATSILCEVIGKESKEICVNIMKENRFSIIVDESTDVSSTKFLCICIRYYDKDLKKITDRFFDLIKVVDSTAEGLYKLITNCFEENSIPLKNVLGFGSDGASVLWGNPDSERARNAQQRNVGAFLKKDIPHIFLLRCICHSFNLICSDACEALPRGIEEFVRDVYNYIQGSPKRIAEFEKIQVLHDLKPRKLLHNCATRWLSVLPAVKRILENWDALNTYFEKVAKVENLHVVNNILAKLQDPQTRIYLDFMNTMLPYFQRLTLIFQREDPEIHNLFQEVSGVFRQIADFRCVSSEISNLNEVLAPGNLLPHENVYLGLEAEIKVNSLQSEEIKNDIRRRCLNFHVAAIKGIIKRFNFNDTFLATLSMLDPFKIESCTSIAPLIKLHQTLLTSDELQLIDQEWRDMKKHIHSVPDEVKKDAFKFWVKMSEIKFGNIFRFENLCRIVFDLFSLPHSSAMVERIFSQMNLNKTKQRNALQEATLESILHAKEMIKNIRNKDDKCKTAINLNVTDRMLSNFNVNMYQHKKKINETTQS